MRDKVNKSSLVERLKEHYNFKTNNELALFLGVAPNTISGWIKRDSIDYDLIFSRCADIDINWLITGQTPKHKSSANIKMGEAIQGQENVLRYLLNFFHEDNIDLESYRYFYLVDTLYSVFDAYDIGFVFNRLYAKYKMDNNKKMFFDDFKKSLGRSKEMYLILHSYEEILNELTDKLLKFADKDGKFSTRFETITEWMDDYPTLLSPQKDVP